MSIDVRQFLRDKGFEVGKRGRFSAEMLEAIKAEHPDLIGPDGKVLRPAAVSTSTNGSGGGADSKSDESGSEATVEAPSEVAGV